MAKNIEPKLKKIGDYLKLEEKVYLKATGKPIFNSFEVEKVLF